MASYHDAIRLRLAAGAKSGSELAKEIGVSQPTASRALASLGDEVIQLGQRRWSRYVLRDHARGVQDIPIYRVDAQGHIKCLGILIPVRPDGYVMQQADGHRLHSDGLPWWLMDMKRRFLGRAYALRHAADLGLPQSLNEWSDAHALRALLVHGHDVVGNLLLGDLARNRFITSQQPEAIAMDAKPAHYTHLALAASTGQMPGSSAGANNPNSPPTPTPMTDLGM